MATPSASQGYFLLADVTGYTAFLTRSELDHAQQVLAQLFKVLLKEVGRPFRVVEVEGDAVFGYALEADLSSGEALVALIDSAYCAFANLRGRMHRHTTCTCTACRLIPELDLKFAVHYGGFVLDRHLHRHEAKPTGRDVVLVHRLLKNAVRERTGIESYALLTDAAVTAAGLGDFAAGLPTHVEEYEHLGAVETVVHDLAPVWAHACETHRVRVEPHQAWLTHEATLRVPRAVAWEVLTDPSFKQRWRKALTITVGGNELAPMGVGTVHHCNHGDVSITEEVIDWRPPEYVTYEQSWPAGARAMVTTELVENGDSMTVRSSIGVPYGRNQVHDWFVVRPFYAFMRRGLRKTNDEFVKELAVVASDVGAGRTPMPPPDETPSVPVGA